MNMSERLKSPVTRARLAAAGAILAAAGAVGVGLAEGSDSGDPKRAETSVPNDQTPNTLAVEISGSDNSENNQSVDSSSQDEEAPGVNDQEPRLPDETGTSGEPIPATEDGVNYNQEPYLPDETGTSGEPIVPESERVPGVNYDQAPYLPDETGTNGEPIPTQGGSGN